MQLRLLTAADAGQYQLVRLRALAECPTAFASSYEEESGESHEIVRQRLNPGSERAVFGAFTDDTLVGVLGLKREEMKKLAHKAYVWGMYVAPEHRKAGAGEMLLRQAIRHAHAWGVRQINLGVNATNVAALALYAKLGFTTFGIERDFLCHDGQYHDEYQMVCFVSDAP
jgi:ribosomal protein S18 acetylase RimI-like enzyme